MLGVQTQTVYMYRSRDTHVLPPNSLSSLSSLYDTELVWEHSHTQREEGELFLIYLFYVML